jgi:arsenate reductase (thioredoxin)
VTATGRRLLAEFTGTGLLVAVVVGSGIAATRLTPDGALRLLVSAVVTALGLAVLILVFAPAGGAHFNPVVTAADWLLGRRSPGRCGLGLTAAVMGCQVAGAIGGAAVADAMFAVPVLAASRTRRGHRPDPHPHLRRDRAGVGPGVHRRRDPRRQSGRAAGRGRAPGPAGPGTRSSVGPAGGLSPERECVLADVPEVLFVCTHNAGRSQMAAALLAQQAAGRVRVTSAGSEPASELNPAVVRVMAEIGLDISREFPKPLTAGKVQAADIVITMGCGDACPVYPGKRYLDWDLPDPAGLTVEQIRPIRDEISARVRTLVSELAA